MEKRNRRCKLEKNKTADDSRKHDDKRNQENVDKLAVSVDIKLKLIIAPVWTTFPVYEQQFNYSNFDEFELLCTRHDYSGEHSLL